MREQKIALGVLTVCGIIALVLSVQRIRAGILNPFTISTKQFEEAKRKVASIDTTAAEESASKRRDTDGDGISDWDETHAYGTSPYLADTDGDGIPDNVEIAMGTDPRCAKGQVCQNTQIDISTLVTSTNPLQPDMAGTSFDDTLATFQRGMNEKKAEVAASTGSTSTYLQPTLIRDPAEIRKFIRDSGKVDPGVLDAITDEQLLQLYDQAMVETAAKQVGSATATVAIPGASIPAFTP